MQFARCFVQLSGDLGTRIAKAPVSPAEVVILRAIHGPEAVNGFELLNGGVNDKTPHSDELQRLRDNYTAQTEDGIPVIDKVFPGHSPKLPTTFDEIGVAVGYNEGKTVKPKGRGKTAVENAAAVTGEDAGDADGDEGEDDKKAED